jgi:hypothetical protein
MKKSRFFIFLILLVFTISGCTSGPGFVPEEQIPPGKALIYFYRPGGMGAAVKYDIHKGSQEGEYIITLKNRGYYPYFVEPGTHVFSAKTEKEFVVAIDVEEGGIYYIKGSVTMGFFVGRPHLEVIHPAAGEIDITECKLLAPEY